MKKNLFILVLCCVFNITNAQYYSSKYYTKEDKESSENRYFAFKIDSNYYELEHCIYNRSGWCGQTNTESISYGFVMRFGDTLILHDVKGGYNMKAIATDTTLQIINGFETLKGRSFAGYGGAYRKYKSTDSLAVRYYDEYLATPKDLYHEIFVGNLYNDTGTQFLFENGKYIEGDKIDNRWKESHDPEYYHLIFNGERYEYRLRDMLLTRGTWRRINTYILFKDESLDAYFIVRLQADNIIETVVFPFANYQFNFIKYR